MGDSSGRRKKVAELLEAARESLDKALAAVDNGSLHRTAATVFHAPDHPDACETARRFALFALESLQEAKVTISSRCSADNGQPILDNPYYNFALAKLVLGELCLFGNRISDAAVEFNAARAVFPFSARILLASGSALRALAANAKDMLEVEKLLKDAIAAANVLVEARKSRQLHVGAVDNQRSDDSEDDTNDGDSSDSDSDDDSWLDDETVDAEIASGTDAKNALTLHLLQQGRPDEAKELLQSLGYKFRLSSSVLRYSLNKAKAASNSFLPVPFVKAIDNALPQDALEYLTNAFEPRSPFWKEHFYSPCTPYFSYTHALLADEEPPKSALDQLITYVHRRVKNLFPAVAKAKAAEWYTKFILQHFLRSIIPGKSGKSSNNKLKRGPQHPIVSCVIYLSENVGGPTLVTNQRLGDPLADCGWIVESKINRLVCFDGSVLHGVVPGRDFHANVHERRTSFMIAFWDHIDIQPDPKDIPGSARPFPGPGGRFSWTKLHAVKSPHDWPGAVLNDVQTVVPSRLEAVWEVVESESRNAKKRKAVDSKGVDGLSYSQSDLGLPNYDLVFQGF
ncbi:hypothetical protein HDU84_007877 [Entophlyctis sp. JEL0112]|nr:hypothetical protein HDU84_007877 [Entophlyctis sp. JEL0112]